ncbi:MAG: TIM barrel protein [Acidobacteriota bacterium]
MIQNLAGGAALYGVRELAPVADVPAINRKGRLKQSVARWCYPKMSVDALSAYGAEIGLRAVDLLNHDEFEIPRRYGLVCSMGYADAGTIKQGLNNPANHSAIEDGLRKAVPLAAKAGVPNVITFSGNRTGMTDDEGLKNSIAGLNRVKKIAEDNGVTLCLELLNSKVNHPDYMADHSAWGVRLMEAVSSPNVKLLYDIYHMQIMEGDLISTIQKNVQWIGHFHTGGVPGRHELNDKQEVQWPAVMRAIAASSYQGYVAHEFLPTEDPKAALLQAVTLCDV